MTFEQILGLVGGVGGAMLVVYSFSAFLAWRKNKLLEEMAKAQIAHDKETLLVLHRIEGFLLGGLGK